MRHQVVITKSAEDDILEISEYVLLHDSFQSAEYVARNIYQAAAGLSQTPGRGHVPPELARIGVFDYREIHFKPYRIIYRLTGGQVRIYCVLDGRRELQDLLENRLLR